MRRRPEGHRPAPSPMPRGPQAAGMPAHLQQWRARRPVAAHLRAARALQQWWRIFFASNSTSYGDDSGGTVPAGHRAHRHGTARLSLRRAVLGLGSRHGGTTRHGTVAPPCPIVPCLAVPVPCRARAARLAVYRPGVVFQIGKACIHNGIIPSRMRIGDRSLMMGLKTQVINDEERGWLDSCMSGRCVVPCASIEKS